MHDHNGKPLRLGDTVMVPCHITQLDSSTDNYCNVTVETFHGRRPDNTKAFFFGINTAQLELVEPQETPVALTSVQEAARRGFNS